MTSDHHSTVDGAHLLDLYGRMRLIRRFEDVVQSLFLRGEVYGTTHLYSGMEAVAVGVADCLEERDRVACTYRGHGHLLARGSDPQALLDELLGRATGTNGGRAGSMNIVDPAIGHLGCFGIVGGSIAAATGASLATKRTGGVAVCFFGDGATNQAYFFECLNFAKVLDLPVLFVCENNQYGEYTPYEEVTAGTIIARAEAMEVPAEAVDGMDVLAVREAAARGGGRRPWRDAVLPGGTHLSLRRPLAVGPGPLPARGRARALARAGSAPRLGRGAHQPVRNRRGAGDARRRGDRGADPGARGECPRCSLPDTRRPAGVRKLSGGEQTTVDVLMPRLSDSMEEATVVKWLKAVGDTVTRGEEIAEIDTDKATVSLEAETTGTLAEIVVPEGGTAALGAVVARLAAAATTAPAAPSAPVAAPTPAVASAPVSGPTSSPSHERAARVAATPVARRTAAELGVPLASVSGTGPGGRIVRADVRAAAAILRRRAGTGRAVRGGARGSTDGRGAETRVELSSVQRTIWRRMVESRTQIPEFELTAEIDMTRAVAMRTELAELENGDVPSLNDLVVRAVALALREHPGLNAGVLGEDVVRFSRVNVGIAVALDDALVVPALYDADLKTLHELAAESRSLVERARARRLTPAELADATFTVSNLGMFGIRSFSAVINPPQVGILAVGEVRRRPAVGADGSFEARDLMEVTLACDHRAVYGADAARFLQRIRELLERPLSLLL